MKKTKITIGLLFILIFSVSATIFASTAFAKPLVVLPDYDPMLLGEDFRNTDLQVDSASIPEDFNAKGKGKDSGGDDLTAEIIDEKWMFYYDGGYLYWAWYYLWDVGNGAEAQIWIQEDLSWPEGDPRPTPVVTPSQVAHLLSEFEGNIIPKDTEYFGEVDIHDGSSSALSPDDYYDALERDIIMVSNIRDDNYYNSEYPYYIAGFYSPSYEYYFDRNIINIDCYNWEDRMGADADRPNLYESIVAHEYQHLIHDDYFVAVGDEIFMNEACSMFAEVLCGYPTDWSGINSFLATPDNSLTQWGDQGDINILADYGAAFLWATFLNDYVHNDFLKDYVYSGWTQGGLVAPGIDLLNYNLGIYEEDRDTFEEVFKAWKLANILGTEYITIDFDDKEVGDLRVYEVKDKWPTEVFGTDFGNTFSILDYDTGVSLLGPYGTDYVLLSKLKSQDKYASELHFDGDEYATVPTWVKDGDAWYSTEAGSLANMLHAAAVELPDVDDLRLVFDTYWDIEDNYPNSEHGWDFGFVQILEDGEDLLELFDWISLSNSYTTDLYHPDAHPNIIGSMPGLTGYSGDWIYDMEFDISAWKGENVHIGFRYMTDWAFEYEGWWIDNVRIYAGETLLDDVTGFFTPAPKTEFIVTVFRETFIDGNYYYDELAEIIWTEGTNDGVIDLEPYLASIGEDLRYPDVLLLISHTTGFADYSFSVVPKYL
jgi:hypothetical protein